MHKKLIGTSLFMIKLSIEFHGIPFIIFRTKSSLINVYNVKTIFKMFDLIVFGRKIRTAIFMIQRLFVIFLELIILIPHAEFTNRYGFTHNKNSC